MAVDDSKAPKQTTDEIISAFRVMRRREALGGVGKFMGVLKDAGKEVHCRSDHLVFSGEAPEIVVQCNNWCIRMEAKK